MPSEEEFVEFQKKYPPMATYTIPADQPSTSVAGHDLHTTSLVKSDELDMVSGYFSKFSDFITIILLKYKLILLGFYK